MTITTIYERDPGSIVHCRDCDYKTLSAVEFSEHVRVCPINPIPLPAAEIERRTGQLILGY